MHLVVLNQIVAILVNSDSKGLCLVGCHRGQTSLALGQSVLHLFNGIVGLSPQTGLLGQESEVEHVVIAITCVGGVAQCGAHLRIGLGVGQVERVGFNHLAIFEHSVGHAQCVEVGAVIAVGQHQYFFLGVELCYLYGGIYILHLGQFRSPRTVGRYQTIVYKVALCGTGVILALTVLGIAILRECAILYVVCTINALVYPVPYTTAHAVG